MNTLVRTLLVWLVLLAVPFQGVATAAMRCAHTATASASASMAVPDHHAAKPPCHGHTDQAAQLVHAGPADTHGGQDDDVSSPHKSCGNCSVCSVGAAMAPAPAAQVPERHPGGPCPSAAPARLAAADPDLPERPPRTDLA